MRRLRIRGLVKLADQVRRELAAPISAEALDRVRGRVGEAVEYIQTLLDDEGLTPDAMPAPTRKAFLFLKDLDLDAVEPSADATGPGLGAGSVGLTGLSSLVRRTCEGLADVASCDAANEIHEVLCRHREAIDRVMDDDGLTVGHLKDRGRRELAWVRYFTDREHFDAYVDAVARARPAFEQAMGPDGRYRPPARVQFTPMKGIYRIRARRDGTRVALPTPMIAAGEDAYVLLAGAAFRREKHDEAIHRHMLSDAYQDVLAELETLAGGRGGFRGIHHDLAAAFERVNAAYFDGRLSRPTLTWGRGFTMRKFGHYDAVHDTVLVSATLDAADVASWLVDYIVYHELLHRELGVAWRNGRRAMHTPEFRQAERRFRRLREAEAALAGLARRMRAGTS